MKNVSKSIAIAAFLIMASVTAFSQVSDSKTEKVKTLMDLTGSSKQIKEVIDVMISSIKKTSPNIPSNVLESMMKELNFEELKTQMVPIYVKHFTEPDIDNLIAFYQSETGQRMMEKMPLLIADYMPLVQERVRLVMEKIKKQQENSAAVEE